MAADVGFADLEQFLRICEALTGGARSLSEVAKKIDIAQTAIHPFLHKLEGHYGERLVERGDRGSGTASLTLVGRRLYEELGRTARWKPKTRRELRLHLSHWLLTSRLFTPFLADYRSRCRLQVRCVPDFPDIIYQLQLPVHDPRALDAALVWGIPERFADSKRYPGIKIHECSGNFELVLISRDEGFLHELRRSRRDQSGTISLESLAAKRIVVLGSGSQALLDRIPYPDTMAGGSRLEVDTIEAAIACVAADIADCALIPASHLELQTIQSRDGIHYLLYGLKIPLIACVRSSTSNKTMDKFLRDLDQYLSLVTPAEISIDWTRVEPKEEFFLDLQYGYYLDYSRHNSGTIDRRRTHADAIKWHWETVRLKRREKDPPDSSKMAFTGMLSNCFGATFSIKAQGRHGLFYAACTQIEETGSLPTMDGSKKSVPSFIASFSAFYEIKGLKVMFGTWTGRDAKGNHASYLSIWSNKRLELPQLITFSQKSVTVLVNHSVKMTSRPQPDPQRILHKETAGTSGVDETEIVLDPSVTGPGSSLNSGLLPDNKSPPF